MFTFGVTWVQIALSINGNDCSVSWVVQTGTAIPWKVNRTSQHRLVGCLLGSNELVRMWTSFDDVLVVGVKARPKVSQTKCLYFG